MTLLYQTVFANPILKVERADPSRRRLSNKEVRPLADRLSQYEPRLSKRERRCLSWALERTTRTIPGKIGIRRLPMKATQQFLKLCAKYGIYSVTV